MNSLGFTDTGFGKGQQKFGFNNNFLVKSKNMEDARGHSQEQNASYNRGIDSNHHSFQNWNRVRQG